MLLHIGLTVGAIGKSPEGAYDAPLPRLVNIKHVCIGVVARARG